MSDALHDPFRVLVVDDDSAMRDSTRVLLTSAGWQVDTVARGEDALAHLQTAAPDVVLCDLRMPGMTGLAFLGAVAGLGPPPILMLSAFGDIDVAVEAVQAGARAFLEKPCDPDRLLAELDAAAREHRLGARGAALRDRLSSLAPLDRIAFGGSTAAATLRRDILDAAASRAALALEGAAGTGRSDIARVIHDLSDRAQDGFQTCSVDAALSGPLPRRGSLYLSGLDRASEADQGRLAATLPEDLRPIVGLTEGGAARLVPELRWRVAPHILTVPRLRDRPDDVMDLFLLELADRTPCPPRLTADDMALLIGHPWPGNLRELTAVAERFLRQAQDGRASIARSIQGALDDAPAAPTLREAVAAFERRLIQQALSDHAGRMDDVAQHLGIGRRTLNEKIVKLGIDKDRALQGAPTSG